MAGPLTIQRVPKGLLHALSMKGSGDLPTELAPQVEPGFDVTSFYLLDNIRSIGAVSSAVGPDGYFDATGNALTVPAGEIWLPINYTLSKLGIGLGTNFTIQPAYARKITNGAQAFPASQVVGVDGDAFLGYDFRLQFILTPGDKLGLVTTNGTYGANPTIQLFLDYYRLEI